MKLRSTIICLLASMLFLFTVVPAQAVPIWGSDASGELTGSRTSVDDPPGGVDATRQWDNGNFTIGWDISQATNGLWTYTYTVKASVKDISHFILEVTDDSEDFNIYDGTSASCLGPDTWDVNSAGNSNPLMPNSIYGVKFNFGSTDVTYTMVTDRAPVYGVFYINDGRDRGNDGSDRGNDVVAWSNALNFDYKKPPITLSTIDYIVRPDGYNGYVPPLTDPIPEPATMLLLGSGLIGFAVSGKKKFKKRKG